MASIVYEDLSSGKEIGIAHSNPTSGEYQITLPAGKKYGFLAKAEGFIAINENLDLTELNEYQELYRDLYLIPIEKGEKIKLNNLFFESGKSEILSESFSELNRIVKLMNDNPKMQIRIDGYTDNIGSEKDNQILSENRAKATLEYLESKGIPISRISSKGYGKNKPIASNSTEEGRSKNRRVEFVILEK
jgi:outer membrane protein OmpA-like peptidoglycan-associated protein